MLLHNVATFAGMYVFLKNNVHAYMDCQICKRPVGVPKAHLTSLPVSAPLIRWHLDFHDSFPESRGKKYILFLLDSKSMWPELIATEDCTADKIATAIFDNIVAPVCLLRGICLLSDSGSEFISKLTATFCKTLKIKKFLTSPLRPQTNSRDEEFAISIHKSLRIFCNDKKDWSQHLHAIAMAYRATATTNTGFVWSRFVLRNSETAE
jgi:hypothetical protein